MQKEIIFVLLHSQPEGKHVAAAKISCCAKITTILCSSNSAKVMLASSEDIKQSRFRKHISSLVHIKVVIF